MITPNTKYDAQFIKSVPTTSFYMAGSGSGIDNSSLKKDSIPPTLRAARQRQGGVRDNESYIEYMSLMESMPMVMEESDPTKTSANEASNYQSTAANAFDHFITTIRELRSEKLKYRRGAILQTIDDTEKALQSGTLDQEGVLKAQATLGKSNLDLRELERDLGDADYKIRAKNQADLDYRMKAEAMQKEERSGMLGSDYNVLDFILNELPQELAGSASSLGYTIGAMVGPYMLKKAVSQAVTMAGGSMSTGPAAAIIAPIVTVASLVGQGYMMYKAREAESEMEAGSFYGQQMEKATAQFMKDNKREPTLQERKQIELDAFKNVEKVKDANMTLAVQDMIQLGLMLIPWSKAVQGAVGTSGAAKLFLGGSTFAIGSFMEAVEEGEQFVINKDAEDDTIPENAGSFDYWFDRKSRTVKAMLGVGDPEIMDDAEFRNSVRSGAIVHGAMTGASTSIGTAYSYSRYLNTKKAAKHFLSTEIESNKDKYRSALLVKAYNKGETANVINVLEKLRNSDFAKDNNITSEDVDNEIKLAKTNLQILKYLHKGKLEGLTDEQRITALSIANSNSRNLTTAKETTTLNASLLNDLYENVQEYTENQPNGFIRAHRLKNRIEALTAKINIAKQEPDKLKVSLKYIDYLEAEKERATSEFKDILDNSDELKEDKLNLPIDEEVTYFEAQNIDSEYEQVNGLLSYMEFMQPDKLYNKLNNIEEKIAEGETMTKDDLEKKAEDVAKEEAPIITTDNEGNEYQYVGKKEGKFTFANTKTGELSTLTEKEVKDKGIRRVEDNAPIKDPTALTDKDGNEYQFIRKSRDGYRFQNLNTGEIEVLTKEEIAERGLKRINETVAETTMSQEEKIFSWTGGEPGSLLDKQSPEYKAYKEELDEQEKEVRQEVSDFIQQEAERVRNEVFKQQEKSERSTAQAVEQSKEDRLAEDKARFITEYGDSKFKNHTFTELFDTFDVDNKEDGFVPVIFNSEAGILFKDKEGQVLFRNDTGKEYYVAGLNSTLPIKANGVHVLKSFLTSFELIADGKTISIQGVYYNLDEQNPLGAIKHNVNGDPVAIVLTRWDGEKIEFYNEVIVNEVAAALELVEAARQEILSYIKESTEDFTIVSDPGSKYGKEYAVYSKDGEWVVVNPGTTKPLPKGHPIAKRVLNSFHAGIQQIIDEFNNTIKSVNEISGKTNEDIKNEIRKINGNIRPATPAEINNTESAAELQDVKGKEVEETRQADESEVTRSKIAISVKRTETLSTVEGKKVKTITFKQKTKAASGKTVERNYKTYDDVEELIVFLGLSEDDAQLIRDAADGGMVSIKNIKILQEASRFKDVTDVIIKGETFTLEVNMKNTEDTKAVVSKEGQKAETEIIQEVVQEKVADAKEEIEETIAPKATETTTDTQDSIEPVDVEEEGTESEKKEYEASLVVSRGLRNVFTAMGWNAKDNPELDKYVSNFKVDLAGHTVEFSIDINNEYFNERPGLLGRIKKGKLTKEDIKDLLKVATGKEKDFDNVIDTLPIKTTLKDKDGNIVPGGDQIWMHRSDFYNIQVPRRIRNMKNVQKKMAEIGKYRINHRLEIRAKRIEVLTALLSGKPYNVKSVRKTKGHHNNDPKGMVGRLKNIRKIFKQKPVLGYADNTGVIKKGNGQDMVSGGLVTPGGIYLETNETANGETTNVKLVPSKISRDHAIIVYKAMVAAYGNTGSYSTVYPGAEVSNLNVGDVIRHLVLEGANFTKIDRKDKSKEHLIKKQLWGTNDGKIFYGDTGVLNIADHTKEDVKKFIDWMTTNKNYVLMKDKLGTKFNKSFKIGNIIVKKGQIYDDVVIDNNFVMTDLNEELPFNAPVLMMDYGTKETTVESREEVREKVDDQIVETVVNSPGEALLRAAEDGEGDRANVERALLIDKRDSLLPDPDFFENQKEMDEAEEAVKKSKEWKALDAKINPTKKPKTKTTKIERKLDSYEKIAELKEGDILNTVLTYKEDDDVKRKVKGQFKIIKNSDGELALKGIHKTETDYNKFDKFSGTLLSNKAKIEEIIKAYRISPLKYEYAKETPNKPAETAKDVKNNIADEMGAPFRSRTFAADTYKLADLKKEIAWIKARFPKEIVNVIEGFIELGDSINFAQLHRDSITVSELAEEGTLYHEAFHRVLRSFLSDSERKAIYDIARKDFKLKEYSDSAIEEIIAEKFRAFVMAKEKDNVKLSNKILEAFKRIYNHMVTLFTGKVKLSNMELNTLFEAINNKRYKYANIKLENEFYYANDPEAILRRATDFSSTQIRTVVKNLTFMAFDTAGVKFIDDVGKIDFELVKTKLVNARNRYNEQIAVFEEQEEVLVEDIEELIRLSNVYTAIVENFADFQTLTEDHLNSLKIAKIEVDPLELEFEKGMGISEFDKTGKASYETSAKDNMLTSVKMLIMTLPETAERDAFTNMYNFVEFDAFWNKIMHDMHNLNSIEEMMETLERLAPNNFPYQILLNKLKGDQILQTQVEVSLRKTKHKFVNVLFDLINGAPSFTFADADVQKASKAYISEWGLKFSESNLFKGKHKIFSRTTMEALKTRLNDVVSLVKQYDVIGSIPEYNDVLKELSAIFNTLSIPLDIKTLDFLIASNEKAVSKYQALKELVTGEGSNKGLLQLFADTSVLMQRTKAIAIKDKRGNQIEDADLFKNESALRQLAEAYIYSRPEEMTVTVLGPKGNSYYVYASNNYVTDTIRKINNDTEGAFIDEMLSVVYNKNSYILNQLQGDNNADKRKNFKINTLAGFIQTNARDEGRDYLGLNEIEDFLLKMAAIQAGKLPMPSLADRKTYYLYEGLDLLDYSFNIKNGKLTIPIDSEVVNTFVGYARDEHERVEKTKNEIDKALANGDTTKLVENYHYIVKGDTGGAKLYEEVESNLFKIFIGNNGEYAGNGARFNYFNHFNSTPYNINNPTQIRTIVSKTLNANVNDTLDFAGELGILRVNPEKKGVGKILGNILLKQSEVKTLADNKFNGNSTFAIYKMMADYTVNTMMSVFETEKIFTGDPAFYKNVDDKIKRLTVLTSTGDNLRINFPEHHELHNKKTYKTATLNTSKIQSDYYGVIREKYIELLKEAGVAEAQAEGIANKKLGDPDSTQGYLGVDQTDAQVFISPEMYRSLAIRLGEWNDEKQYAFDILESKENPTLEEEQTALEIVLKPLKLVYFGTTIENGKAVPVYDKMSMATLFRKVVKGTDLEDLLDRMEAVGKYKGRETIEAIKFDTAVKAGNRHRVNYYTDDKQTTRLDMETNDLVTYDQNFELLRRQQITEPHDVTRTLFGTQVKKVALGNIVRAAMYNNNKTGQELADTVNEMVSALSDFGRDSLLDKLGVDIESVELTDYSKLSALLADNARKSGMSDNIIEALQVDENGNPFLPFDAIPDRKWIENRFLSLVNKHAIDLKLPGNSFIQMTNFGLDNNLKFIRPGKGKTQYIETIVSVNLFKSVIPNYHSLTFEEKRAFIKKLKPELLAYRIPTQGQNSVVTMVVKDILPEQSGDTIVLPSEFTKLTGADFDIDKLFVTRFNYTKEKGDAIKVKYLDDTNSTADQRAKIFVDQAMSNEIAEINKISQMNVKHILNNIKQAEFELNNQKGILKDIADLQRALEATYDSEETAILKEQLAEKKEVKNGINAGLENYKAELQLENESREQDIKDVKQTWLADNKESFSEKPMAKQNIREALENNLLDTYFTILSDEKHFLQVVTPLDAATDVIKNKIVRKIRKAEGKQLRGNWDLFVTSPRYQSGVKAEYTGGKQGIGPFALNNVHHVMGQLSELKLRGSIGVGHIDEDGNTDLSQQFVKGTKDQYITDWLSALINAHVDIAKDPYIYDLNVNSHTYNITNLLMRAGVGEDTFYFLTQPILKELIRELKLQDGRIVGTYNKPSTVIRNKWVKKMVDANRNYNDKTRSTDKIWNQKRLLNDIKYDTTKDGDYYARQLQILDEYIFLNEKAEYLSNAVMASRVDTKKYGKNLIEVKSYMSRYQKVLDDNMLINFESLMDDTFLGTYMNNSIRLAQKLFSGQMISSSKAFMNTHDLILSHINKTYTPNTLLLNKISDEMFSQIVSKFFYDSRYGMGMTRDKYKEMLHGENSTTSKLYKVKTGKMFPELQENRIINLLTYAFDKEGVNPDTILSYNTQVKEKWDKDDITRAWEDLLNPNNSEAVREFGKELVEYSFIASGFKRGIYSFFQYVPITYLKDIGYGDFIKGVLGELNTNEANSTMTSLLDDFFKSNWNDDNIVPTIPVGYTVDRIKNKTRHITTTFKVSRRTDKLYIGRSKIDGSPMYRPYIKVMDGSNNNIYKFAGVVYEGTKSQPVYTVQPKLGYYNKGVAFKEYGLERSVFKSNNEHITPALLIFLEDEVNISTLGTKGAYNGFIAIDKYSEVDSLVAEELQENNMDVMDISKEELLEDYSQTTGQTIGTTNIITPENLKVDLENNTPEKREELKRKFKHCK